MIPAVLATGNPHKVTELTAILGGVVDLTIWAGEVDETGSTFEANALLKAHAGAAATGKLCLADDSGIEVDALDGRPGIHSARWTPEPDWIPRILRELGDRDDRGARYVSAAAAAWPDGREVVVRATTEGRVLRAPAGVGGFGYDPIFAPDEAGGRSFAEMTPEEKQAISHRARSFALLLPHLTNP